MTFSISNIYIVLNIFIWVIFFIIYTKRREYLGVSSFLILFYLSIALVGLHLYNQPSASGWFNEIKMFPFIYLFVLLLLSLTPLLRYNEIEVKEIQRPTNTAIYILSGVAIISAVFQIPEIISNLSSGITQMLTSSAGGEELYKETFLLKAEDAGDGRIENLAAIISGMLSNITILLFFYTLTLKEKNKLIVIGLLISILLYAASSIATGARGATINMLFTTFFTYLLLRTHMTPQLRKRISLSGLIVISVLLIPIALITISRFQNHEEFGVLYSMEYYYGQSFLNFNNHGLDAGGIRYGDRTMTLFKQLFVQDMPRNYLDRRAAYSHMSMDESIFYTHIGDFTLDFGPIITFFIFVVYAIYFSVKTKVKGNILLFHQLVLVYFVLCVCVQGAMTLFSFADVGGNLNIIAFILVYLWFKFDYLKKNNLIVWQK